MILIIYSSAFLQWIPLDTQIPTSLPVGSATASPGSLDTHPAQAWWGLGTLCLGHPSPSFFILILSIIILVGSQVVTTLCDTVQEPLALPLIKHQKPLPPGSDFQDGSLPLRKQNEWVWCARLH